MKRSHLQPIAFLVLMVAATAEAQPQELTAVESQQSTPAGQMTGTVIVEAPINTPGAGFWTAKVGTPLLIVGEQDTWWRVEFVAPFGRRTGWIQKKFVKIDAPVPAAATPAGEKPKPTATPSAQPQATSPQKTTTAAPKQPAQLVFRGFFSFDLTSLTASQTYGALLGSSTVTAMGGGGELGGIWKQLFVRFGVGQTSEVGERALFIDGEVVPVGIPITIKMMPIEILGGWRFTPKGKPRPGIPASATPHAPFSVYVGGGPVFFKYSETSEFGEAADNLNEMFTGFVFYGGLSVDLGRWVFVSGEGGYRIVPNGLGRGGLSAEFGETDLGGAVLRVMVGIRSKK